MGVEVSLWKEIEREHGEFRDGDIVIFEGGYTNTVGLTMSLDDVVKYYENGQVMGMVPVELKMMFTDIDKFK